MKKIQALKEHLCPITGQLIENPVEIDGRVVSTKGYRLAYSSATKKPIAAMEAYKSVQHYLEVIKKMAQQEGFLFYTQKALRAAAANAHLTQEEIKKIAYFDVDLNAVDDYEGQTILQIAICKGNVPFALALLQENNKNDLNLNYQDFGGRTALHCACERGLTDLVALLIKIGINVNLPNYEGNTALHLAAIKNHEAIIGLLLETHADFRCQNINEKTAFDLTTSPAIRQVFEKCTQQIYLNEEKEPIKESKEEESEDDKKMFEDLKEEILKLIVDNKTLAQKINRLELKNPQNEPVSIENSMESSIVSPSPDFIQTEATSSTTNKKRLKTLQNISSQIKNSLLTFKSKKPDPSNSTELTERIPMPPEPPCCDSDSEDSDSEISLQNRRKFI